MAAREPIPATFGNEFLEWFRERTEAAWTAYPTITLDDFIKRGAGGSDWQRGTRWTGGLTDNQIADAEQRWHLRFPPDYRLFLQRLHTVDRPMIGAGFTQPKDTGDSHLVLYDAGSFPNWLEDDYLLESRFDWLFEGLQFNIENADQWRPAWGQQPPTLEERKNAVRALVAAAPKLIPVVSHRYLLAEPCIAGNPVFSIYQSDMIVYGPDLRRYLLHEFADLLGLARKEVEPMVTQEINARYATYAAIPFWGDLLDA